jgi:inner membrane protein
MEPVTHILTGACLARAGFNRRAAYATLTMAVAAEFPDIDTLWGLRGPIEGFEHHRGITHTFVALPVEALVIVGAVWGLHRWRMHRAARRAALERTMSEATATPLRPQPALTVAPVRWGLLYLFALVALLSHLLLDYTNNYGLRPFFPFNDHWYAGSIVFIFDPAIFLLLLAALVTPALIRLVNAEIGARAETFRGRRWALAALAGVLVFWGLRAFEHQRAVQLASQQTVEAPTTTAVEDPGNPNAIPAAVQTTGLAPSAPPPVFLEAQHVLASPDIFNPFRWHTAIDYGPEVQLAEIDSARGTFMPANGVFAKPARSPELVAAQASPLGRAYMDWAAMPVLDVSKATEPGEPTVVIFRDARFLSGFSMLGDRIPLTGIVELDMRRHVASQSLDGRFE